MATFEYQAVNVAGERITGTVLGASIEHALSSLADRGLSVERISQSALINDPLSHIPPEPVTPTVIAPPVRPEFQRPISEAPPTEQRSYFATSVAGPLTGGVPLKYLT